MCATLIGDLMRINSVKKALKEGRLQLGCGFAQLRAPEVAKMLAAAGFDWAFLDAEHGCFGQESLQDLCPRHRWPASRPSCAWPISNTRWWRERSITARRGSSSRASNLRKCWR